jgi:hypothetical protein
LRLPSASERLSIKLLPPAGFVLAPELEGGIRESALECANRMACPIRVDAGRRNP